MGTLIMVLVKTEINYNSVLKTTLRVMDYSAHAVAFEAQIGGRMVAMCKTSIAPYAFATPRLTYLLRPWIRCCVTTNMLICSKFLR